MDLDPSLVRPAADNARPAGVSDLARFEVQDLFEPDLRRANVITTYLLPEFNPKLLPRLLASKPGTRIVTHDGHIGAWPPDGTIELPGRRNWSALGGASSLYLFMVPADAPGTWAQPSAGSTAASGEFRVAQKYQILEVEGRDAGAREQAVRGTRLRGEEIRLVTTGPSSASGLTTTRSAAR